MSRSTVLLFALAGLALLTWITLTLRTGPIETSLEEAVQQALAGYPISGLQVEADGRDLSLSGEVSPRLSPEEVAGIAMGVWGVRDVDVSLVRQRKSGADTADPLNPALDAGRVVRPAGAPSHPMAADACQRTMARLSAVSSLQFAAGSASPMPASYPLLNDLAMVAHQCPDTRLVIGAHTDSGGNRESSERLSLARAQAVAQFFQLAGIPATRIEVVGHADRQPVASNATPEGRASNRRISFDVLPIQ